MNTKYPNINFTFGKEKNSSFSFFDVKIDREDNRFVTSVYSKPTFSEVYTNVLSFIPFINMVWFTLYLFYIGVRFV